MVCQTHKFQKIRLQKLWCPELILTALLLWHMCSRWYTPQLHVVTMHLSHHYIKAYIEAQKKSVSSVCWQEDTACFTLVSDSNRLPARRFLRLLSDRNHWALYCQPYWWQVMDHSLQFRSFVACTILNGWTRISGCNSLVWVDEKKCDV